jgi:ferredoxin, 2Fe-2S
MTERTEPAEEMISLVVIDRTGGRQEVAAATGQPLMEAIGAASIEDVFALCGGNCSCATCHVYIEKPGADPSPMSATEDELLDASESRLPSSRLSCQFILKSEHDGLTVVIAPEE